MKKANTHIKGVFVPKPCHVDWETMDEAEKGRFCQSCSRIVYDFANADPTDFFKVYRENRGNICGSFSAPRETFWQSTGNRIYRRLLQSKAAMLAIGMGLLSLKATRAQTPADSATVVLNEQGFTHLKFNLKDKDTKELIKKTFTVTFKLENYELTINSVTEGVAEFDIPTEMLGENTTIIIESNDYQRIEMTATAKQQLDDIYLKSIDAAEKEAKKAAKKNSNWLSDAGSSGGMWMPHIPANKKYRNVRRLGGCPSF